MIRTFFGMMRLAGVICVAAGAASCGRKTEKAEAPAPIEVVQVDRAPRSQVTAPDEARFQVPENVESKLPIYEIRMSSRDLYAMERDPRTEEVYPADFSGAGMLFKDVKIRYRGAWARSWPKKPLKVFFSEERPFQGQRRLNLNSSFRDPSFIREPLAYYIYNACGSPASTSQVVRVHMNGQFRGVYVPVEQPDKAFLKRIDLKGATIFKADSPTKLSDERQLRGIEEYRRHYEQETQKDETGYQALEKFLAELAGPGDTLEFFQKNVDLEKYINYLAATTLCQNWDSYSKNHFLVLDNRGSKKWFVLPWDLDRSLGDHWDWSFDRANLPIELGTERNPAITGWNRLMNRFFSHPELRGRLADRLQELLEKEFTLAKLGPVIDQMQAALAPDAPLDHQRWPNPNSNMMYRDDKVSLEQSIAVVKRFIEDRRAFLLAELPKVRRD